MERQVERSTLDQITWKRECMISIELYPPMIYSTLNHCVVIIILSTKIIVFTQWFL
jgi:hypothetical protein